MQLTPWPAGLLQPGAQAQEKPPSVLVHTLLAPQRLGLAAHSSTSAVGRGAKAPNQRWLGDIRSSRHYA